MMFSKVGSSCSCFDLLPYKSCEAELKTKLADRSHLVFFMFLQLLDSRLDRTFSSWKMTCDSHVILQVPMWSGNAFSTYRRESGGVNDRLAGCRVRWTMESESRTQFSLTASGIDRSVLRGAHVCACAGTYIWQINSTQEYI